MVAGHTAFEIEVEQKQLTTNKKLTYIKMKMKLTGHALENFIKAN